MVGGASSFTRTLSFVHCWRRMTVFTQKNLGRLEFISLCSSESSFLGPLTAMANRVCVCVREREREREIVSEMTQVTCVKAYKLSHTYVSLSCSTLDGEEVKGCTYREGLKELMDICTLCNDSGLAYNEVGSKASLGYFVQSWHVSNMKKKVAWGVKEARNTIFNMSGNRIVCSQYLSKMVVSSHFVDFQCTQERWGSLRGG